MVLAPPPTHDSAVSPCFHGCLALLHRHFPPQSPPSHPLHPSLHSQQQPLPWDCSTIPKHQFPAAAAFRGPASLSGVGMAAARTVFSFIPFRLPKSSCFTLSLKCFPSDSENCPQCGDQTPALVSPPTEGRSSPTDTPVSPPNSLVLPSFA